MSNTTDRASSLHRAAVIRCSEPPAQGEAPSAVPAAAMVAMAMASAPSTNARNPGATPGSSRVSGPDRTSVRATEVGLQEIRLIASRVTVPMRITSSRYLGSIGGGWQGG